ncbi:hypothetical protein G4H71_21980 [Rhodococcus triatomae]|uniref:Uncharacterized protein n=1 Tax=Rhodococcus triatomae TaxID=300028 RepID=A0A1G8P9I2_9NOCA|nr:hypothetical protein [Rhodococcus triatomae]QNG18730.1 hypothetical protein G4H72_08400 [Rhodococcus triatomae]QNG25360.1 hypothetical protein G4H71_21980 [Rhodococcus triatomae]SDI88420.1 hypothetical protein SAMN05444695_11289 [Rhodococcus triatomae]
MDIPGSSEFTVEDVTAGAHAHGFGTTADGEPYAFRVRGRVLYLEIYRADLDTEVPNAGDVVATAEWPITEIDLTDERSIVAAVRDAVADRDPVVRKPPGEETLRAILGRFGM